MKSAHPRDSYSSLPIICGWPSAKGINLAEQLFSDKAADTAGLLGNLLSTCRPIYAGWHLHWIAAIVIHAVFQCDARSMAKTFWTLKDKMQIFIWSHSPFVCFRTCEWTHGFIENCDLNYYKLWLWTIADHRRVVGLRVVLIVVGAW